MTRWCLLVLLVVACGDDDAPVDAAIDALTDSGVDTGMDAGTWTVAPAAPPAWTCPEGWSSLDIGDETTCAPPGSPMACGAGEARFLDATGCTTVGDTCAEFGDVPSGAIFVRAGGTGSGTRADPLGDLQDALDRASPGDTIALGPGDYDGSFILPDDVRIVGACAAQTRIVWTTADPSRPVVLVNATRRAELSNLTIGPAASVGLFAAGETVLRGIVVEDIEGAGIIVDRLGTLDAEGIVVRRTVPRDGTSGGMGLFVDGGTARGRQWVVRENVRSGVRVEEGGSLSVEDLVSVAQIPGGFLDRAAGITLLGGTVEATRVDLRESTNVALEIEGGQATMRDLFVDGWTAIDPPAATALLVRGDATLTVEGAFLRGDDWLVSGDGAAAVTLRDALLVPSDGGFIWAENVGVSLVDTEGRLERVTIVGGDSGVLANGPFDFTIPPLDPEDPPPPEPDVDPVAFTATDLRIRNTGAGVRFGYALQMDEAIVAEVTRLDVVGARGVGVDIAGDLVLTDANLRDAEPGGDQDGRPSFGRALTVSGDDAEVVVQRLNVERMLEIAVEARTGSLTLTDARIEATAERPCGVDTCSDAPGGTAVGAYFGATLTATNLEVSGAPLCGVQLAFDGQVDLTGGRIEGALVGACVQVDGYDVTRLTNGVSYESNGTNIETTSHAIPEASPPPSFE